MVVHPPLSITIKIMWVFSSYAVCCTLMCAVLSGATAAQSKLNLAQWLDNVICHLKHCLCLCARNIQHLGGYLKVNTALGFPSCYISLLSYLGLSWPVSLYRMNIWEDINASRSRFNSTRKSIRFIHAPVNQPQSDETLIHNYIEKTLY